MKIGPHTKYKYIVHPRRGQPEVSRKQVNQNRPWRPELLRADRYDEDDVVLREFFLGRVKPELDDY